MIASLILLALAVQAKSSANHGSDLFHACQATIRQIDSPSSTSSDPADSAAGAYCLRYFESFGDMNTSDRLHTSSLHVDHASSICLSSSTLGTNIRVYLAYMEKNPRFMDFPTIVGVIFALRETYPSSVKH